MAVSHGSKITYNGESFSETISNESEENLSVVIADSTTDGLVAWTCDVSQLQGLFIYATTEMTIETNDGSSPAQAAFTVGPTSGCMFWTAKIGCINPLTADVTALYVTNASGSEGTLTIKKMEDATV